VIVEEISDLTRAAAVCRFKPDSRNLWSQLRRGAPEPIIIEQRLEFLAGTWAEMIVQ
jgi:hypothetical protein